MQEIMNITQNGTNNGIKYRLYSAHDTNVANIMKTIAPSNNWEYIPYASNIYIELHKSKDEFFVQVKFDGVAVSLADSSDTIYQYTDFVKNMDKVLY